MGVRASLSVSLSRKQSPIFFCFLILFTLSLVVYSCFVFVSSFFFSLCMCEVHAELFFHDNNFKCQVYRNEKNVYDDFDWCVMCIIWRCTRNIDHTQKKKIQNDRRIMQVLWTKTIKKMHELTLTFHISRYWNFLWSFHSVSGQLIHTFRIYVCVVELLALEIRGVCCIIYIRWMLVPSYTCGKRGTSSATTRP